MDATATEQAESGQVEPGHGRETVRRGRTRERLMDAAYRRFAAHGVHATSIEAVAEDAGFTRGAFYSNFESKTELFFALAERENDAWLVSLREHIPKLTRPLHEVRGKPDRALIEQMCAQIMPSELYSSQWCLMYGEFRMLALRDPEVAARFLEIDASFHRGISEIVDAVGAQTGLGFALSSLELTKLMVNQQEAAMREAILSNADDPGAVAQQIMLRTLPTLLDRLIDAP